MTIQLISAEEAIMAATEQAFTDDEGRTTVHSVMISTPIMLGADWDLSELVDELRSAQEIAWFDDPMGHELALRNGNGVYKFEVKRPAVASA